MCQVGEARAHAPPPPPPPPPGAFEPVGGRGWAAEGVGSAAEPRQQLLP